MMRISNEHLNMTCIHWEVILIPCKYDDVMWRLGDL